MNIVVKSEKRQGLGSNAARRLRAQGFVPAVLYGESMESRPLVLSKKDIVQILRLESGENTIFKVAVDADAYDAMIKDLQVDPATDELLHADLIRISMDKPVRVTVPVVHRGEPVGRQDRGRLHRLRHPRGRGRVPAAGHPGEPVDRHLRAPHQPVVQGREHGHPGRRQAHHRPGDRPRPRLHAAQGRGIPRREAGREVVAEEPKEPEVIKKERAEKEEPEK